MRAPAAERRALLASIAGNLVIGIAGVTVSVISSSQAILLDGLFNLTYMATGLFALKVAALAKRGDDARFPVGYSYFEPLVNGIKGVLVLGVSLMAMVGALQALFAGGSEIKAGLAVAYGGFATLVCWTMAALVRTGYKRSGSPLVHADAVNWLINAAISSCVLGAFIVMALIKDTGFDWLTPYVDPSLVLLVVGISIGVPVRMAWSALMQLLNRAPPDEVRAEIEAAVNDSLAGLPVERVTVRVIQPGRSRFASAHVLLAPSGESVSVEALDRARRAAAAKLESADADTILDIVFTRDESFAAVMDS